MVIDADDQGSTFSRLTGQQTQKLWVQKASKNNIVSKILDADEIYDLVIIDTPSCRNEIVGQAIATADLVLIPVQPSPPYISTVPSTHSVYAKVLSLLKENRHKNPCCFLLTLVDQRSSLWRTAKDNLITRFPESPVLESVMVNRVAYKYAMAPGQDLVPNSIADREMERIYNELMQFAPKTDERMVPGKSIGRPKTNPYATDKKLTAFIPEEIHQRLKYESTKRKEPIVKLVVDALVKTYGYGKLIYK